MSQTSDTAHHNERMHERATALSHRLDEVISALMAADRAATEVARSDLDAAGEMATTDHEDLIRCLKDAQFSARTAERIVLDHLGDIRRAAAAAEVNR